MSARKTERLLNLVICLLSTRRFLSAEQIRRAVPGYPEGDEAFKRMFERDKEDLRELGIPLETGSNSAVFDDESGYRVQRDAYALPEIALAPDEAAVLGLAARAWHQASLAAPATSALLKLRATGVDPAEERTPVGIEPRVATREASFPPLWEAVLERRPVRFDYRPSSGTPATRRLEPWGIISWHGRWYVVGHDRDRAAPRVFRLDRVVGDVLADGRAGSVVVPADVDVRATARRLAGPPASGTATVRLRQGAALELRRQAVATRADLDADGWDVVDLPYTDPAGVADGVLAFGADAVVLDPPEVREAVRDRLRAVLAGAGEAGAVRPGGPSGASGATRAPGAAG
ncbi:MAG: helix-turn-helix transcriptional regulator [Actinomycetes bacterium]